MASGAMLRIKEIEKWSRLTPSKPLEVPKINSALQSAKKGSNKEISRNPSLEEMTKLTKKITKDVEQDWENFDIEQKKLLISMVYAAVDHLEVPVKGGLFAQLKWQFTFVFAKARGQEKQIAAWRSSVVGLYNAILTAVERDNKDYQRDLNALCREVTFDPNTGTLIDQENARDAFRDLSSQALR
jgi:hypothetical protein